MHIPLQSKVIVNLPIIVLTNTAWIYIVPYLFEKSTATDPLKTRSN